MDKDPSKRYTCEQLLRHPYFANFQFRLPDSELEEYEKLKRLRSRSKVINCAALSATVGTQVME